MTLIFSRTRLAKRGVILVYILLGYLHLLVRVKIHRLVLMADVQV